MPGIGPARLIITAVGGNGLVEGRMEFELKSFVSTFSDKADMVKNTNRGVVSEIDADHQFGPGRHVRVDPWRQPAERPLYARHDLPGGGHFQPILTRQGRAAAFGRAIIALVTFVLTTAVLLTTGWLVDIDLS